MSSSYFKAPRKRKPPSQRFLALRRVKNTLAVPLKLRIQRPATSSKSKNFYALTQHSRETPTRENLWGLRLGRDGKRRSPLPGSHHPRLSWKFVAGPSSSQPLLLFEVKQPLCVNAAYTGHPTDPAKGRFRHPARKGEAQRAFRTGFHQPPALCGGPSPAILRHSLHIQFRQSIPLAAAVVKIFGGKILILYQGALQNFHAGILLPAGKKCYNTEHTMFYARKMPAEKGGRTGCLCR